VAGRRDIFIPLFRDDRSGYYVLRVKAPSFRAVGLKPDIILQRRPPFDGSVLNVATDDDFGEEPPAASLATPSSSVPTTTRKRTLSDECRLGKTHIQRVHENLGHVDLKRIFKLCDYIDNGILRLVQTPSRDQLADLGTKACPAPQLKFQRFLLHGGLSLDRRLTKGPVFTAALPP
jgi:hypothetical protein